MLHGIEQRSRGTKNSKCLKSISFPARSILLLNYLTTGSAKTPFKDHCCFSLELGESKRSLWTRDFQDPASEMFPINCLFTCEFTLALIIMQGTKKKKGSFHIYTD